MLEGDSAGLMQRAERYNESQSQPDYFAYAFLTLFFLIFGGTITLTILARIFGKKIGPGRYKWLGMEVDTSGSSSSSGSSGWSSGSSGGFSGGGRFIGRRRRVGRMVVLDKDEHKRVSDAIRAAESRTSGEIYCVVCRRSDPYFLAAGFFLSSAVLILGFVLGWLAHRFWFDIEPTQLLGAQLAAWAIGLFLLWRLPALRLMMVPRRIGYRRAHANALQQFFSHNIHVTGERTGVLIFVSLAERYAEIIADSGISSKVGQEEWNAIVGKLTDGARRHHLADALVEAVERSGALLETHFPPGPGDRNELSDHVVEL